MSFGLGLGRGNMSMRHCAEPLLSLQSPSNQHIGTPSRMDFSAATFLIEISDTSPAPLSNQILFYVGDGTTNNAVFIQKRTVSGGQWRIIVTSGGVTIFLRDIPASNILAGRRRIGVTFNADMIQIAIDGYILYTQETAFTPPASFSDGISIGQLGSGGTQTYGQTILRFDCYNTTIRDYALASMTMNNTVRSGITRDVSLDIIAFMGQSNASGRATGTPAYTNTSTMKMIGNNGTLSSYSDPYDVTTGALLSKLDDVNAGRGYAGYTVDGVSGYSARNTAALPVCLGGTTLVDHWNPTKTNGDVINMQGETLAAIQQLKAGMQHGILKAIVWHQGESDAYNGVTSTDHADRLRRWIRFIRRAIGQPNIPVIYNTLHSYDASIGGTAGNWTAISDAIITVAVEDPHGYLNDIRDVTGNPADRVHLDLAGCATVGSRLATIINNL